MHNEARINALKQERAALIEYLRVKITAEDWHGVSDAANDLRVLDAEIRLWVGLPDTIAEHNGRLHAIAASSHKPMISPSPVPGSAKPPAQMVSVQGLDLSLIGIIGSGKNISESVHDLCSSLRFQHYVNGVIGDTDGADGYDVSAEYVNTACSDYGRNTLWGKVAVDRLENIYSEYVSWHVEKFGSKPSM